MTRNGKNVLLVRDLTDAMYNPARWPYVNHFRGTELVIEHIEERVCATTTSDQLLGGKPFKFKGDDRTLYYKIIIIYYKIVICKDLLPFISDKNVSSFNLEAIILGVESKLFSPIATDSIDCSK